MPTTPRINEVSYSGPAGEFIEIRTDAGYDITDLEVEFYDKDGNTATFQYSIAVSTFTMTTDGTYDYYVLFTSLSNGPKAAVSLVEDGTVHDTLVWGAVENVSMDGGSLDGTTETSIGNVQNNPNEETSIQPGDGDGDGDGWVVNPPTVGEENVCFTRGTLIDTDQGPLPIEALTTGMAIKTADGHAAKLRWVGSRYFGLGQLRANPKLRPVRITAGALGGGLPQRDLLVSRQHRLLVRSKIAQRMFGEPEVLVPAIKLTELPGIFVDEALTGVQYFHLLFDSHQIVWSEGAPSESLFTGPEALRSVSAEARDEILSIFPEVATIVHAPRPARPIPAGKQQRQLVARHLKNEKPLLG